MKVRPEMATQYATICDLERTLRQKIEETKDDFAAMGLAQEATNTQGERVLKTNPALAEFRMMARDYAFIVRAQMEIQEDYYAPETGGKLDEIRNRLKAVK